MNRELIAVIDEIGRQKGSIRPGSLARSSPALQTAAKKRFGQAENIQVEIDSKTGRNFGRPRKLLSIPWPIPKLKSPKEARV